MVAVHLQGSSSAGPKIHKLAVALYFYVLYQLLHEDVDVFGQHDGRLQWSIFAALAALAETLHLDGAFRIHQVHVEGYRHLNRGPASRTTAAFEP